tara:strand:+ start:879 stop:1352 length:474 start_codon:yes stop_codon:yes gene_type:complete
MFKDFQVAEAHCDIPCKIYDPAISQVATLSVIRLIDLLNEIDESDNSLKSIAHRSRLVIEKEAQAKIVKNEVNIIWGDYFKEPQIESHPNVHTLVHEIMMTASKCKQDIIRENAEELLKKVNEFATIFWSTKGIETENVVCPYPPELIVSRPKLNSV